MIRFLEYLLGAARAYAGMTAAVADSKTDLDYIKRTLATMSTTLSTGLDALKADIAAQTSVIASAATFITGLSAQLTSALASASAAGAPPDQLQELTDLDAAVKANTDSLSTALTTNTPAASDAPVAADPVPVAPAAPVVADPAPVSTAVAPAPDVAS